MSSSSKLAERLGIPVTTVNPFTGWSHDPIVTRTVRDETLNNGSGGMVEQTITLSALLSDLNDQFHTVCGFRDRLLEAIRAEGYIIGVDGDVVTLMKRKTAPVE